LFPFSPVSAFKQVLKLYQSSQWWPGIYLKFQGIANILSDQRNYSSNRKETILIFFSLTPTCFILEAEDVTRMKQNNENKDRVF
jgi:hypothetical protein